MKKIIAQQTICLVLALISTYIFFSCQQKEVDIIKEPYAEKQAQVAKLLDEIFTTAKGKDFEKLNAFHLNSPKFSKFDIGGLPNRQNHEENRQGEEAAFKALEGFDYKLKDIKVDVFDKVAISSFIISYTAKVQGMPFADTARSTLVFFETDGKWKITHEHFSKFK